MLLNPTKEGESNVVTLSALQSKSEKFLADGWVRDGTDETDSRGTYFFLYACKNACSAMGMEKNYFKWPFTGRGIHVFEEQIVVP